MDIIQDFKDYLFNCLSLKSTVVVFEEKIFPFFLQNRYSIYQVKIIDDFYLLIVNESEEIETPASIYKNMLIFREKTGMEVIYVNERISSYDRRRLVDHKVSFVMPGNQLYLPLTGIDFHEHFRKERSLSITFKPSTQAAVLCALYENHIAAITPKESAHRLNYTPMTMTRAFDELELSNLAKVKSKGKERVLTFMESKKELWTLAVPFLKSPTKRSVFVEANLYFEESLPKAGLMALSEYSMLAAPNRKTYAVSRDEWKLLKQNNKIIELPKTEIEAIELEIWNYSPTLFSGDGLIDRLSLYLSLKDEQDERVELALDELLGDVKW